MSGPSFATTAAAFAKAKADLYAQGYLGTMVLAPKTGPATKGDPLVGSVVVVPTAGQIGAPRIMGGNPRATFTIARSLDIHVYASNGPQLDPSTQYMADLAAAETLTALVLRSFEIYIPGAKNGGRSDITQAGENLFGVEIVNTISIDIELPDTTYTLADPATVKRQFDAMNFPTGSRDSGSDQFA